MMALLLAVGLFGLGCVPAPGPESIDGQRLAEMIARKERFVLVDVRTPAEYSGGHIPTAINIPHYEITIRPPSSNKDELIVLYCRSGNRSGQALQALRQAGYRRVVNFGGLSRWSGPLRR